MALTRKRGGQPGNRNARKHGFYSTNMSPREICEFYKMLNLGGVDREIAILRIKIGSALYSTLRNRRVLADASRLLAKWCRSKYHLVAEENIELKKLVRHILEEADTQFYNTNHS